MKNENSRFNKIEVTQGPWLPAARGGHAAGIVGGHVFVTGGTNWTYDKTKKLWLCDSLYYDGSAWLPAATLPHAVAYCAYASDSSGIYIAGGSDGNSPISKVYFLPGVNSTWQSLPDLPEKITFTSGTIHKNRFYVACGQTASGYTNSIFSLELNTKYPLWKKCSPLPASPRALTAVIPVGDYIYLLGGMANEGDKVLAFSDCCRYDPQTDKWLQLNDLPVNGYAWNGVALDSDHILLAGRADGQIHTDILCVDLLTTRTLNVANSLIPTTTAPLIRHNDELWLIGGEPNSNKTRTPAISIIKIP